MARLSAGNVFLFVMAVAIGSLLLLALIGYLTGGWQQPPL